MSDRDTPAIAEEILTMLKDNPAITDIQIRQDAPIFFKLPVGYVRHASEKIINRDDIWDFLKYVSTSNDVVKEMMNSPRGDYNTAYTLEDATRLRINAFYHGQGQQIQDQRLGISIRCQPLKVPSMDTLGVPEIMKFFVEHKGLVLVTGPTSAGKSTTLAATIQYINKQDEGTKNIITIEDPIEYDIPSNKSIVTQREVGSGYLKSINEGILSALRQAPNVIMIGEARDKETFSSMLRAGTTGHLVLASMHTTSAKETIETILTSFEGEEAKTKATALASCLVGVVSQRLVPSVDGTENLLATECMIVNQDIRGYIRSQDFAKITNAMSARRDQMSSYTLNVELVEMVRQKLILPKAALAASYDQDDLKSLLKEHGLAT